MPNSAKNLKELNIQLVRSPIGYSKNQNLIVKALGFRKLNSIVSHYDSATIRGMVTKIRHLVAVEGEKSAAGIEFGRK
jgi:large subunit ribosomal protein L30